MAAIIDMKGKVALVTGAGSGLGRATAVRLAEAGANLCIVDINSAALDETAQILTGSGVDVLVHAANLAAADRCAEAVESTISKFGRLDALCNIAGVIKMARSHEMPREDFAMTLAVNLAAPWYLSQVAIPHLLANNGAIVNCASSAAFIGEAYAAAYCASKAGLVNMTKAMAMEYARQPIRINAVAPGGMMTNIATGMTFPESAEMDLVARYSGLRGLVEVQDVADVIAMLASPAGRSYHGACINIDAGITAG